jgi:hypothetical protein
MKLSHHIRVYMLKRQANALLRRASRPHKQSAHMIGRTSRAYGADALVGLVVAVAFAVAVNIVRNELVSPDMPAPVQVANQK